MKAGICLCLLSSLTAVAGCTLVASGPDESALNARLPTGVTLLESDQERCDGDVQIEEAAADRNRTSGLVLQAGQNATVEIDSDNDDDAIQWTCLAENSSDTAAVDCPDATSHVRVTRAGSGGDLLLECYG